MKVKCENTVQTSYCYKDIIMGIILKKTGFCLQVDDHLIDDFINNNIIMGT